METSVTTLLQPVEKKIFFPASHKDDVWATVGSSPSTSTFLPPWPQRLHLAGSEVFSVPGALQTPRKMC
jgi:hypothetical protein